MKSINTYIGTFVLTLGLTTASTAQQGVENYLMNDCEEATIENALIANANEWQDDLIAAAINGPSEERITEQTSRLSRQFAQIQAAAKNEDYAWLTPEYREKILSTTQEEFVDRELNNFILKYKQQAERGIGILRDNNLISENLEMELIAFPNPASEIVTISAKPGTEVNYKISIIDLSGTISTTGYESVGAIISYEFSVVDLPAGVYLIQVITSAGQVATERLVVE